MSAENEGLYEVEIGQDHSLTLKATASGEYALRIDRPSGTGRPLYDTMMLSGDELRAIWEAIIDTGEVG